jgi:hypothetical protein
MNKSEYQVSTSGGLPRKWIVRRQNKCLKNLQFAIHPSGAPQIGVQHQTQHHTGRDNNRCHQPVKAQGTQEGDYMGKQY